jgi:DNA transformation protein
VAEFLMAQSDPFHAFVAELFAGLGPIRIRKMFGGAGVYAGAHMFALLADDVIYLKADDALQAKLAVEGSAPFVWEPTSGPKAGQKIEMGYWRLPETALDDAEEAALWGRAALALALSRAPAGRVGSKSSGRTAKGRSRTGSPSRRTQRSD